MIATSNVIARRTKTRGSLRMQSTCLSLAVKLCKATHPTFANFTVFEGTMIVLSVSIPCTRDICTIPYRRTVQRSSHIRWPCVYVCIKNIGYCSQTELPVQSLTTDNQRRAPAPALTPNINDRGLSADSDSNLILPTKLVVELKASWSSG